MTEADTLPFDLCLSLGYAHPDYLLPLLSAKHILDWQWYAAQYGLPPRRNDIHWGMSQSLQYNIHKDGKSSAEPPSTFMPYLASNLDTLDEDISAEELSAKIMAGLGNH